MTGNGKYLFKVGKGRYHCNVILYREYLSLRLGLYGWAFKWPRVKLPIIKCDECGFKWNKDYAKQYWRDESLSRLPHDVCPDPYGKHAS